MQNDGWVKLHRKILEWEWYDDLHAFKLFMHLLLTANHERKKWRGQWIERGERVTSYAKLAEETTLSFSQIRSTLKKLILTHEVTHVGSRQYSRIKVINYDMYQTRDIRIDNKIARRTHTLDTRLTTNKNDKNDKNINTEASPVDKNVDNWDFPSSGALNSDLIRKRDDLKKKTNAKPSPITKEFQARAFEIAKKLEIKLTPKNKSAWLSKFKKYSPDVIQMAYAKVVDNGNAKSKEKLFYWHLTHPAGVS